MNTKMKRFADASMGKITSLENQLSRVLKPIKPRKEFVSGIAQHFQTGTKAAFVERMANWHLIAMLFAVSISMAVFLAVVLGALRSLLGRKRTA